MLGILTAAGIVIVLLVIVCSERTEAASRHVGAQQKTTVKKYSKRR